MDSTLSPNSSHPETEHSQQHLSTYSRSTGRGHTLLGEPPPVLNGWFQDGASEFAFDQAQELDLSVDMVENVAARAARDLLSEGKREEAEHILEHAGHFGSELTTLIEPLQDDEE
jgi:hypothetical protein